MVGLDSDRDALALNHNDLGVLLLATGIGSVVVFPLTKHWMLVHGSLWVMRCSAVIGALVLPVIALGSWWRGTSGMSMLMLALCVTGAAGSMLDVGMNAQAVLVEQHSGRSLMSRFHALYSLGGLCGAGGVMLAASVRMAPWLHLGLVILWSLLNVAWA